ncbi:aldehyde oxidase and xanthine dehydrogenase molybdopterin binding [Catenulispora acidiphila DSM 44928]|uniref:Aldehyde oxidase and xanthine dehydrogenase molybdopterin binding n=1 Tax=Catenulispora acidiphila (strain DSM 44928 / JCM 14897 / NBRC 102108 / NRRL B-24433 / ID139908) TaxID=479433 RepID=C7PZJ3_CATAD|nr:xanthine dehydrogenase family protein molybdopterin-binding subunit [Catenulispora acidiphila]ACU71650.1 aldehyde oxidase and xanthine dehydrogenase molybdopterin binding [Catenulispora acidiphila DSM 44928]
MTFLSETDAIGRDLPRRDGSAKVMGTATYAYETPLDDAVYLHLIQATIARGRVTEWDTAAAEALDGVVAVLTPRNAERLASTEDRELAVLQDEEIHFRGQVIAAVVADSSEVARQAAAVVRVGYAQVAHDAELRADDDNLYAPEKVNAGFPTDTAEGDVEAAMAAAEVTVEETYTTAMYHNNPMEPHATAALWDPAGEGFLTLWDSTQGVHPTRSKVASVFGLDKAQIRVVCPYVGGGFGSKGQPHVNVVLAALAARAVPGRPVRLALTRQQMFSLVGYRTPTIQRCRLGADRGGTLSAVAIDVVEQTSRIKEFAEQTGVPARMMYASPNRRTTHRLAALDVPVPSWMRAPGECPGMFGPEVAMDELAERLGMDPVDLRIRNEPDVEPGSGKPFSSRDLVGCLREGAARFGWSTRDPRPGVRRQGDWLVGTGVAASTYPVSRMSESTATIRREGDRYITEIGAADLGTGTWTTLPQIAADALGVPVAHVDVRIGDTDYPMASVAGGSSGMTTWGSAVVEAARAFREKYGTEPPDGAEASGSVGPPDDRYAMHAFGAQFAEAHVHADTGEVRVRHLLGVFAAGRIINPRTARSQFIGGMTMGLSMALHESSVLDPRTGHVVNHDFAEYHITANADVAKIEAHWLPEHDTHVNAMGSKGIGEIGIVGTAAAVSNAVWHACGVRVRDLPITLDKVLYALEERPEA